ncbi:MAG: hypothetical protein CFE21_18910 [Bacteroidetes bacterium B1(2017)]|nr:MAG: hypothetical protein CFE21_18910 [Bacteroidetes bacterium B1(2017)]
MNNIPERQNQPKQLERLAAQRELYSSAKKFQIFQIVINIIIPVLLSLLAIKCEEVAPYSAFLGVLFSILDVSFIEQEIKNRREKAAKIQELFDCYVLELPISPLKVITDITVEEILIHYHAHSKIPTNVEKIRDWYSTAVSNVPLPIARLICQRSNCWWDSRLRKRYSFSLGVLGVIITLFLGYLGIHEKLSFNNFVLIASSISPFILYIIKQYNDQKEAAKRLDDLVNFSSNIWESSFNMDEHEILDNSRKLQDEIFDHRSKSPLILDFFYNKLRNKDEEIMNKTADSLVSEALERIGRNHQP